MKASFPEVTAQRAPCFLSDDWLEAFRTQCTDELLKKAKRYAERRARAVGFAGGVVDDYYVSELVQDVLGDIVQGVLRWDPSVESLEGNVLDAIASRARHHVEHAQKFPHMSIDSSDPDTARAVLAAADAAVLAAHESSTATVALAQDASAELVRLGDDDSEVQEVLSALVLGATSKADVLLMSGLSDSAYHAARGRIDRLVAKLSRGARPSGQALKKRA